MKTIVTLILAAVCLSAFAADEPKKAFNAGEFQGDIFGAVATKDLDTARGHYGFGVSYYLPWIESLGVGVRTSFDELGGHTFENITPRVLWRVPVGGKHALYAFAQATRTFHDDTGWSTAAGPGYEYRTFQHVGFYGEISMLKDIAGPNRSTDTFGVGEVGLRLTW